MNTNRNLEVGDKVCEITSHIGGTTYHFSEVARVTKTQAILKNGEKYHRQGHPYWGKDYICWDIINSYSTSHLELDRQEVRNLAAEQKHVNNVNSFWSSFKPTFEQKEKIYELFNKE